MQATAVGADRQICSLVFLSHSDVEVLITAGRHVDFYDLDIGRSISYKLNNNPLLSYSPLFFSFFFLLMRQFFFFTLIIDFIYIHTHVVHIHFLIFKRPHF